MASPRSAWGIDVGNRALKAVKLVRDGDAIRVDDFDFIEHETILSLAGDNRDDLIRHAIATFVGRKSVKGSAVAVGVSGQTSFARFIKLPPVDAKQIPQIVKFEAIQQIPFPLDEVEWAYQLFQSPDSPDIECGIFAMRKELVNDWVGRFTQNDLNVQAVQMNPLAVYNAVQRDGRLTDGTAMIIDVGAENTDLIIAGENSIWMRSIPIGGNSFTETIMKAFKLPMAKAEELKRDAAGSKYYRQILQAMRPVFADLVAEIQRSIGFYGSVNRENKINKIIAMGGTFRMPSLPKYLQQNLSLDVERPDNFAASLPEDSKTAAALTENVLSLHAAYGLALQAMGETKVDSSLLPTAIRKQKMWQEKNKWFAIAAAMCVAAPVLSVASWVINRTAFGAQIDDRTRSDEVRTQAEQLSNQWKNEVQTAGGPELQTIKNVNGLLAFRDLWPNIVADISAALPAPPADLAKAIVQGDKDAIMKTPRGERKLLQIDSLQSFYVPDIGPVLRSGNLASQVPTGGGGRFGEGAFTPTAPVEGAPASTGQRGFLVSARLISPNQAAESELVSNEFFKRLEAVAPTAQMPKRSYAFVHPEFNSAHRLGEDRELIERFRADVTAMNAAKEQVAAPSAPSSPGGPAAYQGGGAPNTGEGTVGAVPGGSYPGAGGGYPGAGGGGASAPNAGDLDALHDRVTNEDTSRDRVIDVTFAIILDPPEFGTAAALAPAAAEPGAVPVPAAAPVAPPAPPRVTSGGGARRSSGGGGPVPSTGGN